MVNFEWIVEDSNTKENQTRIRRHVMRNYAEKRGRSSIAVDASGCVSAGPLESAATEDTKRTSKRPRTRRRQRERIPKPQVDLAPTAERPDSTESTADSKFDSHSTPGQPSVPSAATSVTKYMIDPFASTPIKAHAANYTIFQDFANMPRYNKTVREHYDFIHENKFRFAVEDPLMFLTVSLEVLWQRCARQNVASTPGLKYVQLQAEKFLSSRLSSALADINSAVASPSHDQLERRNVAEVSVLQPLMHLCFLHKKYGDPHLSDKFQGIFDRLLSQMQQRLPDSVRLEECTLFGSIVSCEPLHMPKVLGPEEAREARKDLQELFSCMESVEERMRTIRIAPQGPPSVLGLGFLRPGSLVRRILVDSPGLDSWQTLSFAYLNCRFAALLMLLDATTCEVGNQFLDSLNQKLSDLDVEVDSGSIFTLVIVLLADSEFRDSQRNYRVARILRSACKHLAEDIIRTLSEGILTSLIGSATSAVDFDTVQSLRLESLQPPLLQTPRSEGSSPSDIAAALFSQAEMDDPSFGSPVTPSLLNTYPASRTQRLKDYIAYFASHVWYQHPKVDCASDFLANWGPMISHGEALLYSVAGAAATHIALTESPTARLSSQDAVAFKTRAMELIRRTVEAEDARSILIISAIAFLAGSEAFDCGNIAAASSHLQGISQLVQLRGGIQTLGWQIMEIIYIVDLQVASMTLTRPRFPFVENPDIAPAVRVKARNTASTPIALPPTVARLFRPDFTELFEQVRDLALFRHVAPTELRTPIENLLSSLPQNIGFLFSYQKLYVGHSLLSQLARHLPLLTREIHRRGALMARDAQIFEQYLPSADSETKFDNLSLRQNSASLYNDTIARCVQIATLLFVYMTTSRVGSSTSSALIKTLSANLQNALLDAASQPSWQQIDVYHLHIWTFFIGALATERQPLWPWFVDGMTQRLGGFRTISEVREMLRHFLYVDDLFDSSLTMMQAESTLGYLG